MLTDDLIELSEAVLQTARGVGARLATAESCTGGLVIAALTDIAGASEVVERGYVTYSNAAKSQALGVPEPLIAEHGAVSEPVARAMAEGALRAAQVELAVAVTGIAGPGGGSVDKPVGLVWFATARAGAPTLSQAERFGDLGRGAVRQAAAGTALRLLHARLCEAAASP